MKRKYDKEILDWINLFQNLTHTNAKDCFKFDDILYFIVPEGQIGKAIGKNGSNVKRLRKKLNKDIKIIEYNENPKEFIKNIIYPLKPNEVIVEDKKATIKSDDRQVKGKIIGRSSSNLKKTKKIVQRFFDIEDITVE